MKQKRGGWRLGWRRTGRIPPLLVVLLLPLLTVSVCPAHGEPITPNFRDVELRALIETVSQVTGRNFILDPQVKGKVTVVSSRPMEGEAFYRLFLSILEVHGYIAVPEGEVIKILPAGDLKHSGAPQLGDGPEGGGDGAAASGGHGDEQVVVRVFTLENVDANRLMPVLRPLISPKGHISPYPPGNLLIVADYALQMERLAQIIRRVDRPATAEVEPIVLQHASAADLVRVLTALERQGGQPQENASVLVADERTNTILIGGDRSDRLRIRALITHLDTPVEGSGDTRVVFLRHARGEDVLPVLKGLAEQYAKERGKAPGGAGEPVSVQDYPSANALVITAPPALFQTMAGVIRQLDSRRAQVQVEAVIAEVSSDRAAELGVQWRLMPGRDGRGALAGTSFSTGGNNLNQLSSAPNGAGNGLSIGFLDGSRTLLGTEYLNLGVLLRALQSDANTNVLSTPSVVTLDNAEAEIVVGQNVPFVTGSYTTSNDSATVTPFQTIQRENVGLTLRVKPQINDQGTIRLDIFQDVSSISASSVGAADVITNTRSIKTSVLVENNQILVLGGLITDDLQQRDEQVPVLGGLPLLGNLFHYRRNTNTKTNLMVFLRSSILAGPDDGLEITRSRYRFLRQRQGEVPPPPWPVNAAGTPTVLPPFGQALQMERMLLEPPAATPAPTPGPLQAAVPHPLGGVGTGVTP